MVENHRATGPHCKGGLNGWPPLDKKALAAVAGYHIDICDTSRSTGLSAAARRYAAFNKDNRDVVAVAIIYGAR